MIVHVFNSTLVSGPETLVIPSLPLLEKPATVVLLAESRRADESKKVEDYVRRIGVPLRVITVRGRVDSAAIREFASVLNDLKPSVVHAHDVKASTYLLKAAKQIKDRDFPIVSTHHGVRGRFGWKIKLYEWFYAKLVLPYFDRVLAVCTTDGELLRARGLQNSKVVVHLNGVDRPEVSQEARLATRTELHRAWNLEAYGIPPDSIVIGFAGRLATEKRIDRILKLMSALQNRATLPRWDLVIFGIGPLGDSLKEQASALKLDQRVHWLGYRSGLGDEMSGFDLLLSLSDAEGLPINLVEAGWSGTPVFATKVDGNLDLIPSERYGILVSTEESEEQMADALASLIGDTSKRRSIGAAYQKRIKEHFSGAKWRKELLEIYSKIEKSNGYQLS